MSRPAKVRPATVLRAAGRTARATTRRPGFSDSTRRAILDSASELFCARGYAGTSLDAVVARAQVTKGALYHHWRSKQAVFEAVFEELEAGSVQTISNAVQQHTDPWTRASVGLSTFLDVCREPTYRRVVMQEGPAVLGFERWRMTEKRSTYGLVRDIVSGLLTGDQVDDSLTETFAQVFFGAMRAAGLAVAASDDAERTSAEVEVVIGSVLTGLRTLAEGAAVLPPTHPPDAEQA